MKQGESSSASGVPAGEQRAYGMGAGKLYGEDIVVSFAAVCPRDQLDHCVHGHIQVWYLRPSVVGWHACTEGRYTTRSDM